MDTLHLTTGTDTLECIYTARIEAWTVDDWTRDTTVHLNPRDLVSYLCIFQQQQQQKKNKSCRRTASSPAGYILYCNIFIIKPYNIGHTDLDVFVCKSFCHIDIIIQV